MFVIRFRSSLHVIFYSKVSVLLTSAIGYNGPSTVSLTSCCCGESAVVYPVTKVTLVGNVGTVCG